MRSDSHTFSFTSIYMLSALDIDPKRAISEVKVHAGAKFGHTGRSPNAVRVHAQTTQGDFEVDRPPPADSPGRDPLITMVKETVILYKKSFEKKKKVKPVRISH